MARSYVRWIGLNKLADRLGRASPELRKRLRRELRDLAKPIRNEMKRAARAAWRRKRGNLVGGIKYRIKVRNNADFFLVVGPITNRASHAHLLEKGTQERSTRKGARRGMVVGKPTFVPVIHRWNQEARRRFARVFRGI